MVCPKCGKEIHLGDQMKDIWFVPYPECYVYDSATDYVVDHLPCGWFVVRRPYWLPAR